MENRIHKFVSKEVELIENLECVTNLKSGLLSQLQPGIEIQIILKEKQSRGFLLEILSNSPLTLEIGDEKEILINNNFLNLKLNSYLNKIENSISIDTNSSFKYSFSISNFNDIKFEDNVEYYCRKVIPIKEDNLNYFHTFDSTSYRYNQGALRAGLIKLEISNIAFHIFTIEKENSLYLFIDCLHKINLDIFNELAWSLIISFGYLIGFLPQDNEFNFYYENDDLENFYTYSYRETRPSLKSLYPPITSNPYAWISNYYEAKEYESKIKPISYTQFSKLCQLVHDEIDIKTILLLIMESSTRTLIMMPAGLSIALEGLSSFFNNKNNAKSKLINDTNLIKQLKNELTTVLNKYKNHDSFGNKEFAILKEKIDQINSPTNMQKLIAPFSVLGINITVFDEEAIRSRNEFLHGNINLKISKGRHQYNMTVYEISLRLLTLINCAIMKMVGYEGYIINHVKTQNIRKNIDEENFRKI